MNWNEEFARANAGKTIRVTFYGVPLRGRVVGFSNDKQDISDQKVLCATDMGIAASPRIAPFHKAKRSYTLMASVLHDDYVFTFHKEDANEVVIEDGPTTTKESPAAENAPSGNPDAKAWQDAWNAKFKTYNRMTRFLANLSMKSFPIELERERHEIVHLAMKEINPKAVENDAKAFNEMASKVKDR